MIATGAGLSGGGDLSINRSFNLADTSVTPGSYTLAGITVDQQGRITAASNGSVIGVETGNVIGQILFWNGTMWVPASGLSWDSPQKTFFVEYSEAIRTGFKTTSAGDLDIVPTGGGVRVPALGVGTPANDNYNVSASISRAFAGYSYGRGLSFVLTDTSTATSTHYIQGVFGVVYSDLVDGVDNTGYVRGGEFSVINRKSNTNVTTMEGLSVSAGIYGVAGADTTATATVVNGLNVSILSRASGGITLARGINLTAPNLGTTGTFSGLNINATANVMTNKYGILMGDISGGTSNNYAIYTNLGGVRFGDSLEVAGRVTEAGTFAEIHVSDNSVAQSIPAVTYTKSTAFDSNGFSSNCTPDAANGKITITKTGVYRVDGTISFSSRTKDIIFFGSAFLAGVEQDQIHWSRMIRTVGDVANANFTGFVNVTSVPADLDFRLRHDGGTSINITASYANLNVSYLGE